MDAARDLLRRARARTGTASQVDGAPLTVERVKAAMAQAFVRARHHRRRLHRRAGPAGRSRPRHGLRARSAPGVPIVIDVWPRDNESFMLRRHDAHVRRRRRARTTCASGTGSARRRSTARSRRSRTAPTAARSSTARATSSRRPASRRSGRRTPGETLVGRLLPRARSRRRARGARGSPGWGSPRSDRSIAGDVVTVEPGLLPAGLRRRAARGPRARDRGRRREPDAATRTTSTP